jgi:hypothetical protein
MVTFSEACEMEPVEEPFFVEDNMAWHRTYAECWGNTPEAKKWEPILDSMRREYITNYQGILEADPQYRPLVEKFWFHMTNSANSDGRWPPPPAETCPFNRDWVLHEIDCTKNTLKEIASALNGRTTPPQISDPDLEETWEYGLKFTEKDIENISQLNTYELSHALYAAFRMFDVGEGAIKEKGKLRVNQIFEEFERRGFDGMEYRRV